MALSTETNAEATTADTKTTAVTETIDITTQAETTSLVSTSTVHKSSETFTTSPASTSTVLKSSETFTTSQASTSTVLTSSDTSASNVGAASTTPAEPGPGVPLGAIIGPIVVALVVIAVVIVVVIVVIRRRNRRPKVQSPNTSSPKTNPKTTTLPSNRTLRQIMKEKRQTVTDLFRSGTRKASIDINNLTYKHTAMPGALKRISDRRSERQPSLDSSDLQEDDENPVYIGTSRPSSSVGSDMPQSYSANGTYTGNAQEDYCNASQVSQTPKESQYIHLDGCNPEGRGSYSDQQDDYMNSSQVVQTPQLSKHTVITETRVEDDIIDEHEVISHNRGRRPTFDEFAPPPPIPDQVDYTNALSVQTKQNTTGKSGASNFDPIDEVGTGNDEPEITPPPPLSEQEEYMNIVQVVHTPQQSRRGNKDSDYITASRRGLPDVSTSSHTNPYHDSSQDDMQEEYMNVSEVEQQSDYATPSSISIHDISSQKFQDGSQYATPSSIAIMGNPTAGYTAATVSSDEKAEDVEDTDHNDGMKYQSGRRPTFAELGVAPPVPQQMDNVPALPSLQNVASSSESEEDN